VLECGPGKDHDPSLEDMSAPQEEGSSFLGQMLSYRVTWGGIMDACNQFDGSRSWPHCPSLPPDYDSAALSPSKWEANKEANKCSWDARVNQTFCRSLV